MDDVLKKLYYSTKHGYIGARPLWEKATEDSPKIMRAVKLKDVQDWLREQPVNQIHYEDTRKKNYLPIFSNTPYSFQIDLTFLPKFKQANRGYTILLTAININTRRGYAYKMKKKSEAYDALVRFIDEATPNTITSDNGGEFISRRVLDLFDRKGVRFFTVPAGDKHMVGMIERFNRTIKERLNKYFTHTGKPIWYDVLDDMLENYNNTVHSSIGQSPNSVQTKDESRIIQEAMLKTQAILNSRRQVDEGDYVRVPLKKKLFDKGEPTYSKAVYVVKSVNDTGSEIKVSGRNESFKHEDVLLVSKVVDVDDSEVQKAKKGARVERRLRKEGVSESNIIPGRRGTKKPVKT